MASLGTTNTSALVEIARGGPEGFAKLSLVKYSTVISCTIVFLEIFAKMEEEVAYIWPSPWTFAKVLYIVNRYSPVIDTVMSITSTHSTTLTQKECATEYQVLGTVYAIGSYSSEFILITRTLALYNFNPWIIASMCILAIVLVVPSTVVSINFLIHGPHPPSDIIRITGCVPSVDDFEAFVGFACVIVSETVIVALTLYRRWETSGCKLRIPWISSKISPRPRNDPIRSPIVRTMYRDGSYFYIFLLIVSVANLCVTTLESPAGRSILQWPVRAIHSALCTRVLLNLRAAAAQTSELPTTTFVKVAALAFEESYSYTRQEVALEVETDNVDEDSLTYSRVQE